MEVALGGQKYGNWKSSLVLNTVQQLIQDYQVPEGFVFDYKKKQWHRCALDKDGAERDNSYCEAIQRNLSELLG